MYSLIVPVYKNEGSVPDLIASVKSIESQLNGELELVCVVDGSPDRSYEILRELLPSSGLKFQLACLSRNFGSFAAIKAGLKISKGDFFSVMAADLQEPIELTIKFFNELSSEEYDVIVGTRESRDDPFINRMMSKIFWSLYRMLVQPEMPKGGVDVFGCNKAFRNEVLKLNESHSSLIGLIFWLGFRRKSIGYKRLGRFYGKSAWTLKKKIKYMSDSIFSFSDLPIKMLTGVGLMGILMSITLSGLVLISKISGFISVPGYAATVLVILFFASLNSLGLGIIGNYIWRAFENTKQRPDLVILKVEKKGGDD